MAICQTLAELWRFNGFYFRIAVSAILDFKTRILTVGTFERGIVRYCAKFRVNRSNRS